MRMKYRQHRKNSVSYKLYSFGYPFSIVGIVPVSIAWNEVRETFDVQPESDGILPLLYIHLVERDELSTRSAT